MLLTNKYFSSLSTRYYKITDPGSWISVDKHTGELRVANTIDRESELVYNGIYNITMKAVDASRLLLMMYTLLLMTSVSNGDHT